MSVPRLGSGGEQIEKFSLKGGRSFERGGLSRGGAHSIKYGKYNLVNNKIDSKKLSCNFHLASFYLVNSFSGKVNVSLGLDSLIFSLDLFCKEDLDAGDVFAE